MKASIGVAVVAALASSAIAGPQVEFDNAPGGSFSVNGGTGGAFLANILGGDSFRTFCVELNEHINFSDNYNYTVNDYATAGGQVDTDNNPGDGKDYLSDTTRNIFYRFATGADLSAYGNDATQIADVVQLALWNLEEGVSLQKSGSERLAGSFGVYGSFSAAASALITANSGSLLPGAANVKVMNIYRADDGSNGQDMLILIPLPSVSGMAFVGLLGVAAYRRRQA